MSTLKSPRLLIISHNQLSLSDSNGRTLLNLVSKFDNSSVSQICISHNNKEIFSTYFLNFYSKNKNKNIKLFKAIFQGYFFNFIKKFAFRYFIRDIYWNFRLINQKKLISEFVFHHKPTHILLQISDYLFMMKLALNISNLFKIPIILINSEEYYFKKFPFYYFLQNLYKIKYKFFFNLLIKKSKLIIHNTKYLNDLHSKKFSIRSKVIMNSSHAFNLNTNLSDKKNGNIKYGFVYAGNLNLERYKSIILFAKILKNILPEVAVDIFSSNQNSYITNKLKKYSNINYNGYVPYDKLILEIYQHCKGILHVESFSSHISKDIKYGFSTKIPDILASKNPFIAFLPKSLTLYDYLKVNKLALLASNEIELIDCLKNKINNFHLLNQIRLNQDKTIKKNHDLNKNSQIFLKMV